MSTCTVNTQGLYTLPCYNHLDFISFFHGQATNTLRSYKYECVPIYALTNPCRKIKIAICGHQTDSPLTLCLVW